MNQSNHPLDRLLRAAAKVPLAAPAAPPFAVETRVLAEWRRGPGEDELAFLVNLFRRAALLAACVMMLAIGWSWLARIGETPSKTTLPKCAMNVQLRP